MNNSAIEDIEHIAEVNGNDTSSNRLLLAIVIGTVALVVIALVATLMRPEQDYLPDDSPLGVAHNYLFALEKGEYERAYSYISPTTTGHPEHFEEFIASLDTYSFLNLDHRTTFQFELATASDTSVTVAVKETVFQKEGIFGRDGYTSTFKMKLHLENGEWKIIDSDWYFAWCWKREEGCP
jgi:hypothetical protein